MRIQDETDCHLSRLSRSLMTRTAFGRVLTPAVQAPGIETPGFIISFFFPRSSSSACPCLHRANLYTRSFLSLFLPASFRRYHRVSRFFFHGARAFETVEFDLLGLTRDPSSPETIRVAWDKGKSFCGVHSRFGF